MRNIVWRLESRGSPGDPAIKNALRFLFLNENGSTALRLPVMKNEKNKKYEKKPLDAPVAGKDMDDARLGQEIRKLRKARGHTLTDLATAIGRSVSFISQVERGNAALSITDLKGIAQILEVPLGWFFSHDQVPSGERGKIVRGTDRRRLGALTSGLLEELLSPDIGGAFEMFLSTFEPGAELGTPQRRNTEEEGYVVAGALDLWIGRKRFTIKAGDSFRIVREPFRWANPYPENAVVVWVISPPTY